MKLYGKDRLVAYFDAVQKNDAVGHLYIFDGAVGMGKRTFCRYLAEWLLCTGEVKPCAVCGHCVKIRSGNHPDVIWVTAEEKNPLNVERARALVAEMYVKPFLAERKIYIIPEGETLSVAVQNTLLKAFEEPPAYVTILLCTTSADALLKTVRSRGVLLPVPGCRTEDICAFLKEKYPEKADVISSVAAQSAGSIGIAEKLCADEAYTEMRKELYDAMSGLGGSFADIYPICACFEKNKASQKTLFSLFTAWMRDVLASREGAEAVNTDYADKIAAFAEKITPRSVLRCAEKVSRTAAEIGTGSDYILWITEMLSECWRYCHDADNRSQI